MTSKIYIKVCLYADDYKSVYKHFFLKILLTHDNKETER
jgi:hypothetical protein